MSGFVAQALCPFAAFGNLHLMSIDIVSVILVVAMCSLFLCIALALAVDRQAPEPGCYWWIAGFAALAAGFCLNGLQALLPPMLSLIIGTTLLVTGLGLLLIGTQHFLPARTRYEPWVVAAVLLTAGSSLALLYVWPSVNARIVVSNTIMAGLILALANMLVRHAPENLAAPAKLKAAAAILIAILLAGRIGAAILSPPMESPLGPSMVNVLVFFGSALVQLAFGLGCYFMLMMRRTAALEALSATDPLTGSLNRRGLEIVTSRAEHDYRRNWTAFSVIALDLDHFKNVNDTYGHATGDVVLQHLAQECRRNLRGDSVVARLGGEEFCVLLPGSKMADAMTVAERIRTSFAETRVTVDDVAIECTVSLGVAQCHDGATDFAAVAREADAALYRAKFAGRNRVEAAPLI